MTYRKYALAALAAVGLTAGTVLAVAEPTPPELPQTIPAFGSCPACPGKACGTAKCAAAAASAVSACTAKCAATSGSTANTNCPEQKCSHTPVGAATAGAGNTILQVLGEAATAADEILSDVAAQSADRPLGPKYGRTVESIEPVSAEIPDDNAIGGPVMPSGTFASVPGGRVPVLRQADGSVVAVGPVEPDDNGCPDGRCESKKKKRITVHFGFGTNGPIFHVSKTDEPAAAEQASCQNDSCPASACGKCCETAACEKCSGKAGCDTCPVSACNQAACTAGACEKGVCTAACEKCCDESAVVATSCEAKSACSASACTATACTASTCTASACPNAACAATACSDCPNAACGSCPLADCRAAGHDVVSADAACSCQDCCCEACDCSNDACPPAPSPAHAAFALHRFAFPTGEHAVGRTFLFRTDAPAFCPADPTCHADFLAGHSPEAPGRVRLTHLPELRLLAAPPAILSSPADFLVTSFAAPVVAPLPHTAARSNNPVEGTWTRSVGPVTMTFTGRTGRIDGTVRVEGNDAPLVRFSGVCSTSSDGLLYGVIESVETDPGYRAPVTLRLLDQPFSVRFTTDGDSLIVKDFRCAGLSPKTEAGDSPDLLEEIRLAACGRFTRTDAE